MGITILLIAVIILLFLAVMGLIVGVSNDAVNFLSASIGSRVASLYTIMTVACLGIIFGVTFSSGMMEVARKGIFHPYLFTMPELIVIFLGVMLTNVLLLDLFSTFGLPTSTTVSIVFGLLGAAVAGSLVKIMQAGAQISDIGLYINTGTAMFIVFGILFSVVVAFFAGSIVQFASRIIFTFNYEKRLKRYGALWGGVAMSCISFFILIKGAKGSSFMNPENLAWIQSHSWTILGCIFLIFGAIFHVLIVFFRINILKLIVLIGTFALAMAFAANDLVNFIGVPLAGLHAYKVAAASSDPMSIKMVALSEPIRSETFLLLIAGVIMVITLCVSRKARSVIDTTVSLGQQDEGVETFESTPLSRVIVRMTSSFFGMVTSIIPKRVTDLLAHRVDPNYYPQSSKQENRAAFDLIRASVILMVSSAIISFATSLKLPLSTTYVTFMVAMGASFADKAWGSESAVFRVTGVLTVVGGWFMTAVAAFTMAFVFVGIIEYLKTPGLIGLIIFTLFSFWATNRKHQDIVKKTEDTNIFNLEEVDHAPEGVSCTFEHMEHLMEEIQESIEITLVGLFTQDVTVLKREKKRIKQVQIWINIIIANIFKTLRLLQNEEKDISYTYAKTIRRLQKLSDSYRDIVLRSYVHVGNNHKGLLDEQKEELDEVWKRVSDILKEVEAQFNAKQIADNTDVMIKYSELRVLTEQLANKQIDRIPDHTSKTRLNILYYSILGDCNVVTKQILKLLEIFNSSYTFQYNVQDKSEQ